MLLLVRVKYFTAVVLSLYLSPIYHTIHTYSSSIWQAVTSKLHSKIAGSISSFTHLADSMTAMATSDVHRDNSRRMPVYFLSIGGPNFINAIEHPAYAKLALVGQEITTKVKPKAVVVFSAHWQGSPTKILINSAEKTDLIYDFYGFPPHYYKYDYPNTGSPSVAEEIVEKLEEAGIEVERVKRGLDHGVWAGFMAGNGHR
jgi:hypothetical protein